MVDAQICLLKKGFRFRRQLTILVFSVQSLLSKKKLLLGIYDCPTGTPIFAAWDVTANASHTQKSCQVQVEDLQAAISEKVHPCTDSRGNNIFTFLPDHLGDYIDLVSAGKVCSNDFFSISIIANVHYVESLLKRC